MDDPRERGSWRDRQTVALSYLGRLSSALFLIRYVLIDGPPILWHVLLRLIEYDADGLKKVK